MEEGTARPSENRMALFLRECCCGTTPGCSHGSQKEPDATERLPSAAPLKGTNKLVTSLSKPRNDQLCFGCVHFFPHTGYVVVKVKKWNSKGCVR